MSCEGDPTKPIDRDHVKAKVRFLLGGVSEEVVSDELLDLVLVDCILKYGDSQDKTCEVTYCLLIEVLKYLIRKHMAEQGDSKGVMTGYKEKEGDIEVDLRYSVNESSESGWQWLYHYFKEKPEEICECLRRPFTKGRIHIGGVDQQEYVNNQENPNNRTVYDTESIGTRYSARRELRNRRARNRSKFRW